MWEHLKKYPVFWIFVVIFGILGIIIFMMMAKMSKMKKSQEETEEDTEQQESEESQRAQTLSSKDSSLYQSLIKYLSAKGFSESYAKMAVAQSRHETGNYTSALCQRYNNYFGMMQPQRRDTVSIGATPSGFASYNSMDESAEDYVLYLDALGYPKEGYSTLKEYIADARKRGYFTDSFVNYYNDTQKLFNSIKINS